MSDSHSLIRIFTGRILDSQEGCEGRSTTKSEKNKYHLISPSDLAYRELNSKCIRVIEMSANSGMHIKKIEDSNDTALLRLCVKSGCFSQGKRKFEGWG